MITRTLSLAASAMLTTSVIAQVKPPVNPTPTPLLPVSQITDSRTYVAYQSQIQSVTAASNGTFTGVLSQAFGYFGQAPTVTIDCSQALGIAFQVKNSNNVSAFYDLHLDFAANAAATTTSPANSYFTIAPNSTATVVFVLRPAWLGGVPMQSLPPLVPGQTQTVYDTTLNPGQANVLKRWYIQSRTTPGLSTSALKVQVSNLQLVPGSINTTNLVDMYGQSTLSNWQTQVGSQATFASNTAAENADLGANQNVSLFDGLSTASLGATGHWHVAKSSLGNSFFVTPTGHPFWALGINSFREPTATVTQGRTSDFEWLPTSSDPLHQFMGTVNLNGVSSTYFDFRMANLYRKFGPSWDSSWVSEARTRMGSWGTNTVAGWSDARISGTSIPFEGQAFSSNCAQMPAPTGYCSIADPFAPGFTQTIAANIKSNLGAKLTQSNLMGIYVDNELNWGLTYYTTYNTDLVQAILRGPSSGAARQALINWLKAKYATTAQLNNAWGTKYTSWSTAAADGGPAPLSPQAYADCTALLGYVASTYYANVKSAIGSVAPNVMYLGSRMGLWGTPDVVVQAATKYVDVLSMNLYYMPDQLPGGYLASLSKPVLITEFSFGACDQGALPAFGSSGTQAMTSQSARVAALGTYLNNALSNPNVIGADYYEYVDQPVTGRNDGENFNTGMTSIVDCPYQGMVDALRAFSRSMYSKRQ